MMQDCSEKFIVSGVVQGVGFRYHTSYQGQKLGLVGYAKNLANGDVEVVVCGSEAAIELMADWLAQGPKTSVVDNVVRDNIAYKPYKGFQIL